MKGASWLNLMVGIWLLVSPAWASAGTGGFGGNAALFGIAVIAISIWSLVANPANHAPAWLNLAIGVWMFISGWVLGYETTAVLWNGVITGVLLVVFSVARMSTPRITASRV